MVELAWLVVEAWILKRVVVVVPSVFVGYYDILVSLAAY